MFIYESVKLSYRHRHTQTRTGRKTQIHTDTNRHIVFSDRKTSKYKQKRSTNFWLRNNFLVEAFKISLFEIKLVM